MRKKTERNQTRHNLPYLNISSFSIYYVVLHFDLVISPFIIAIRGISGYREGLKQPVRPPDLFLALQPASPELFSRRAAKAKPERSC